MKTTYRIHWTGDNYADAVIVADRLRGSGKQAGVELVLNWNQMHPDRPVRTANRYLVYFQERRA